MAIIFNHDFGRRLEEKLKNSSSSVIILSAFLKLEALKWLTKHISPGVTVTIVSRWKLVDILSGASDLTAYEFASEKGWTFAINTNMHFKVYLIDKKILFLGSANITGRGMHIGFDGNDEASIGVVPSEIDLAKLEKYAATCCLMDDELYSEMKQYANKIHQIHPEKQSVKWPQNISDSIVIPKDQLWVADLLFNSPAAIQDSDADFVDHDLILLGLDDISSLDQKDRIIKSLRSSTVWHWLLNIIENDEDEFVRFGKITAQLHDALVDDPKPYRSDIKRLLSNLYDWIKYLEPSEIGIRKFNRTEALYLRQH